MYARHRHRHRSLFPDLRLEGYGLVRGVGPSRRRNHNIRAAWAEAEVFVIRQLRMGTHPDVLEREIHEELLMSNRNDYKHDCLLYTQRILRNLRTAGQLAGLPTFTQFEDIRLLRPRRARYEMMMYDRFRNFDVVSRFGGDIEIAREIARTRALDREAEEELRRMREADRNQLEEQYRANEEILRAELQDARFRAERAESQLQFEQRRRQMGGMPAAGYAPLQNQYFPVAVPQAAPFPYPHAPVPAFPIPQQYYAPPMNGRDQHDRRQVNRMLNAGRDDFRPQRPNQYQQQQDDYQRNNESSIYDSRSGYTSTIYSEDSRYRRRR